MSTSNVIPFVRETHARKRLMFKAAPVPWTVTNAQWLEQTLFPVRVAVEAHKLDYEQLRDQYLQADEGPQLMLETLQLLMDGREQLEAALEILSEAQKRFIITVDAMVRYGITF